MNSSLWSKSFSMLQKIGKCLMLPVSVLPIAGILLGVGSAHFGIWPEAVSDMMAQSGDAIFSSLPLMFAIGVALGLTNNDGVSALAAMIGYMVMIAAMGVMAGILGVETKSIYGIQSINTGVFGGILIGAVSANLFNRFYRIQLPSYLGFFGGKRFVPIVTAFAAILTGGVLAFVWPPIGRGIQEFSHWAATTSPALAFTIYGIGERALIPFGLHHIWNVPFFFETGSYLDPTSGKVVAGEIARFLAGDPTAGNLAGGYLFKMWGLPAAAFAIWHSSRPENKAKIGGVMLSAALTSFVTGITEPIEFSFLFVAPILYGIHALLSGFAFFLCIVLGIQHGTTFSHGLIDFLILFPKSTNGLWLWVIGPIWGIVYYTAFRFVISRFDLKTPGRDTEVEVVSDPDPSGDNPEVSEDQREVVAVIAALGGVRNIRTLDACITRLRVELMDVKLANPEALKKIGAAGVVQIGSGLQAVFGTRSENIKTRVEEFLRAGEALVGPLAKSAKPSREALDPNQIAAVFGGRQNIESVTLTAMSRVRVQVKDVTFVDSGRLGMLTEERAVPTAVGVWHLVLGDQAAKMVESLGG